MRPITIALLGSLVAGCVASPLYTGSRRMAAGPEVPRDARGEPIISEIRPVPNAISPPRRSKPHRSGHWFGLF